jgi:hypothetical protein
LRKQSSIELAKALRIFGGDFQPRRRTHPNPPKRHRLKARRSEESRVAQRRLIEQVVKGQNPKRVAVDGVFGVKVCQFSDALIPQAL